MEILTKFVSKNWGWENWLVNNEKYCGKILFVKKGKRCSWHYHKIKDETFHILSGQVTLYYHTEDCLKSNGELDLSRVNMMTLVEGDSFHIPIGMRHLFYGTRDSQIIEISTQHFDDDSYRLIPS